MSEPVSKPMSRNLVLCCDGTNNQFGSENTNVLRLVQTVDRDPPRRDERPQLIFYDPGVGTMPEPGLWTSIGKRISEAFALAFGAGLTRNVEEAYTFLMQNWQPGDQVYLFGFSRGAYTVRVLAGLLHALGLLPRDSHNLLPYAMKLFSAVRGEMTTTSAQPDEPVKLDAGARRKRLSDRRTYWDLCDEFRWTYARPVAEGDDERRFPVHFLGLWDTVSSVGWVWDPRSYPFTAKNPSVRAARHAIALDERRAFFRQNLMNGAPGQDLQDRWFPGVHADVGGGYREREGRLWQAPFEWMLDEAAAFGLRIDRSRREEVLSRTPIADLPEGVDPSRPWTDPQHESLTIAWRPVEYFPKKHRTSRSWLGYRCNRGRRRTVRTGAMIHESTLLRIRDKPDYRPPNLSSAFVDKVRALAEVNGPMPYQP